MCLIVDKKLTEELKNHHHSYITAYKKLCRDENGFFSPYRHMRWNTGQNYSNSNFLSRFMGKISGRINRGIHVYLDEKIIYWNYFQVVVRVRCEIKDLIAVGYSDDSKSIKEAVFTKVYLDKYALAVGNTSGEA